MKSLILGDLHFGVKQDDPWMQNIQSELIDKAIEYSKEHGIKVWIQSGDWFDVRKAVTHQTMHFNRSMVQRIVDAGIEVHAVVGNHDAAYKNTLTPNAMDELLASAPGFHIYSKPKTVLIGNVEVDMIPWMCEDNTGEILKHIKNTTARFCVGHWELNGFYFYRGMKSHGLEPAFLSGYDKVYSGHFHTISERGNIKYVGTPYTITGGDANDSRGFWVVDFETKEERLIENKMWHKKINYPSDIDIDVKSLTGLSVSVIVEEMDSKFTKFESSLEAVVHDLKVVSRIDNSVEESDEEIEVKNIKDLMIEWVDAVDAEEPEKKQLKSMVSTLYVEASNGN